jgi:hypothetical protein
MSQTVIKQLLDQGVVKECPERRSLFRLFRSLHRFSNCTEAEDFDEAERKQYALP